MSKARVQTFPPTPSTLCINQEGEEESFLFPVSIPISFQFVFKQLKGETPPSKTKGAMKWSLITLCIQDRKAYTKDVPTAWAGGCLGQQDTDSLLCKGL